jgi:hypothetical protein
MCPAKNYTGYRPHNIPATAYKNNFMIGEQAMLLISLDKKTPQPQDKVSALYVIHDQDGKLVSSSEETRTWDGFWDERYCKYEMPNMPSTAGVYTVSVYFDGAYAGAYTFTISAN